MMTEMLARTCCIIIARKWRDKICLTKYTVGEYNCQPDNFLGKKLPNIIDWRDKICLTKYKVGEYNCLADNFLGKKLPKLLTGVIRRARILASE